jgi:hypothetical protein
VEIQSRLPEVSIGEVDQPVWGTKSGVFSSAETWKELRKKKKKAWSGMAWGSLVLCSYSYISMLSSFGLLSKMLLLLEKRCVDGVTRVIFSAFSVALNRKV